MMDAIVAAFASGRDWEQALILGAAAGAVNFLRHGLGTGSRPTVEEIAAKVRLTPL